MKQTLSHLLRARRESSGLSQQELAEAVGVSRQSILAIEAGRHSPSVDLALRMADILGSTVEELFGQAQPQSRLFAEHVGSVNCNRVALARIGGHWLSYPLQGQESGRAACGIVEHARGKRTEVIPLRPIPSLRDNVVLMGCAPALGLLADRLNTSNGTGHFLWFSRSSASALTALGHGQTHLAGVHLTDKRTGEQNLPDVRRHLRKKRVAMITLARWEVGLLTAPGNPGRIHSVADVKPNRMACREPGSGARRLLEREWAKNGLPDSHTEKCTMVVHGHHAVAMAITLGAADAGIASRDAALAFGLSFFPLAEERYDLVIPRSLYRSAAGPDEFRNADADVYVDKSQEENMKKMLDLLHTATFQRELRALGYDTRHCGLHVVEGTP
ncbi:MAG TPA: substrate-binding domain-containing protein [Pseudomonadota bacterium]|nr:substrate-binding domain-containing protein [Pseudomonadota bacterium]